MYDLGAEIEIRLKKFQKTSVASIFYVPTPSEIQLHYPADEILDLAFLLASYSDSRLSSKEDTLEVQLIPFPEYVRVLIADTGEGLLPNSELFDFFPRGEFGLMNPPVILDPALAEASALAKKFECKIWVQSKFKMGTVFHVDVPYVLESRKFTPIPKKDPKLKGFG